jgi:MFS transporter, ACS family, hexuronate transporter
MNTTAAPNRAGYQIGLVVLLALNFGIVFFDRNALGFLGPYVKPDLGLSNTQWGLFGSGLSLTWALAAFLIGMVSDKTGSRKGLLILSTLCFSVCSFLSGLATSFLLLLGARLLMGVAEGGIMPISQTLIAEEVSPRLRGLSMGFAQNFGSNLFGSFLAPLVLGGLAASHGWRSAFYIAGVPGLVTALIMWMYIRKSKEGPAAPVRPTASATGPKMTLWQAFEERNVLICAVMGVLMVSYFVVCLSFMPLYLTEVRKLDAETANFLMSALGLSATIGSFGISALSDRIGRRPLMILMPFIGVILPLGAMYFGGGTWAMAGIFFVGWGLVGIFPLFMATVPSESVDARHVATVMGICMGSCEIIGGVLSPFLAGFLSDLAGLQAALWLMIVVTVLSGLLAFGLRETAPRVLAKRGVAVAAAG